MIRVVFVGGQALARAGFCGAFEDEGGVAVVGEVGRAVGWGGVPGQVVGAVGVGRCGEGV